MRRDCPIPSPSPATSWLLQVIEKRPGCTVTVYPGLSESTRFSPELDARAAAATTSEETPGTVVYERSSTTEDLDFVAATGVLEEGLSQAI